MQNNIFIRGNIASSKNGRQWTGKHSIASKSCQKFYKETRQQWIDDKDRFLSMLEGKPKPYKIEMLFVRSSRRKFDYINPAQSIQDQMVKFGWLEDDNATEMIPSFAPYQYDKLNPGCYITVL